MSKTYKKFLQLYAANKPWEDLSIQKALGHFNNQSPAKPFEITLVQNEANHHRIHYDAMLSNGERDIKIEAKTDQKSKVTGNFFLEFQQYGKASGLSTTEADYYVITDAVAFYLISVDDIGEVLHMLDEEGLLRTRTHRNEEKKETKGYVVPRKRLIDFAVDIT